MSVKLRSKLYSLSPTGNWKDEGAGWTEIDSSYIIFSFDSPASGFEIRQFKSKIPQTLESFQHEGGLIYINFNIIILHK